MKPLKEGQRVRVKSIDIKGSIFFIDQPNYWNDHMRPVQVELDKPYDRHGQQMYRTDIKDVARLKPKKKEEPKKKRKVSKKHEEIIFDFSE